METLSLPRGSLSRSGSQLRLRRINGNFQRSLLPEGSDPSSQLRLRRINGNKFFLGDSRNRKSGSQLRLRRINGNIHYMNQSHQIHLFSASAEAN